jgi:hypothetical protein
MSQADLGDPVLSPPVPIDQIVVCLGCLSDIGQRYVSASIRFEHGILWAPTMGGQLTFREVAFADPILGFGRSIAKPGNLFLTLGSGYNPVAVRIKTAGEGLDEIQRCFLAHVPRDREVTRVAVGIAHVTDAPVPYSERLASSLLPILVFVLR